MMSKAWKWTAALVVSLGLHAAAAGYMSLREDVVEIAGGGTTEISIAGDAFVDMVAASETEQTVAPEIEADVAVTQPDVVEIEAERVPVEVVVTPEQVIPEPTETPPQEKPEVVETTEVAPTAETLEPVEAVEEVAALVELPVPTPRPAYTPPKQAEPKKQIAEKPKPRKKSVKKAARKKQVAKKPEDTKGADSKNAKRGTTAGQAKGKQVAKGRKTANASRAGNAQVSNYPGKVVSKLRRSLRYPRAARSKRLRGEVRVQFTVLRNGSVSGIRVVRSSGSPVLDKAALDTVRRAAPFPKIPQAAGRSSWGFTVPLAFVR